MEAIGLAPETGPGEFLTGGCWSGIPVLMLKNLTALRVYALYEQITEFSDH
jgi:hypothetical protein